MDALNAWSTTVLAVIAGVALLGARGQIQEARRLRKSTSRAYVTVHAEGDKETRTINLFITNAGKTHAEDVNITFDPPLEAAAGHLEPPEDRGLLETASDPTRRNHSHCSRQRPPPSRKRSSNEFHRHGRLRISGDGRDVDLYLHDRPRRSRIRGATHHVGRPEHSEANEGSRNNCTNAARAVRRGGLKAARALPFRARWTDHAGSADPGRF